MNAANPIDDPQRLSALQSSGLLDSNPENAFDRLTELASRIFDVPVALVSLVDDDRQFFKSCVGLPEPYDTTRQTPLSHSFCKHVVVTGEPLIVPDARLHETLKTNPAVEQLGVVAYAGMPLTSSSGHQFGSFCIIDNRPRDWDENQLYLLRCIADCVQQEMRLSDQQAQTDRSLEKAKEIAKRQNIFLAQLSHELRNPLSPILNAAQMLCAGDVSESDKPMIYEVLRDQTLQVVRMVNDMLDLSRVEQGKMRVDLKRVDLRSVIESSVNAIRSSAVEFGHRIDVQPASEPVVVLGDFDRLVQIMSNLLTNACRYTPDGGEIEVDIESVNELVSISVTDNGVGIPADQIDEVFKVFNQAEPSEMTKAGLGLGLALVKQLVKLHHGTVAVKSEGVDQGSCFTISLPLCESSEEFNVAPLGSDNTNDEAMPRRKFDVLIVEDIYAVSFMFERLLKSAGHDVRVAADVEEAQQMIADDLPEIIFSDIGLPGVNGFEFASMLKADAETGDVPLVAMTGSSSNRDVKRALNAGFDYFLAKPIDIREVGEVIDEICDAVAAL